MSDTMAEPFPGAAATEPTRFTVDGGGVIQTVSGGWDAFAAGNGAPELVGGAVVGRSLWSFVGEPTTLRIYQVLLARALAGAKIVVPFRCDAPDIRRFMELHMTAHGEGIVECEAVLVRAEPRPTLHLFSAAAPRSRELLRTCSWCKKVSVAGSWLPAEEAVAALGLVNGLPQPAVSHGICPVCMDLVARLQLGKTPRFVPSEPNSI